MPKIKAHCVLHDKWFVLETDEEQGRQVVTNFVDLSAEEAEAIDTELSETSCRVSSVLRPCMKCGSRKAGTCSHVQALHLCDARYSYQCLFCNQLKISYKKATGRFTEWVGKNIIPGAATDRFGNAKGSQYDLAKDGSYDGFKVAILCLYTGENIVRGLKDPIRAMEKKGFRVELKTEVSPQELKSFLADACQLWVISDRTQHLNSAHLSVIREFYEAGHGLYIFGDNDPFYADANYISSGLFGTTMYGNTPGDKVIGVQSRNGATGIIREHPISTGIVNVYEGVTIATIRTTAQVKPLMISSAKQVVTGIVDENGRRALIDGGFTRLFVKWNTAGTDRLIVNAAAWLANAENAGSEVNFT
jgi:hypothetical protein